ncbi:MAG: glycosyltransferase [Phycisphaerae bacterium]
MNKSKRILVISALSYEPIKMFFQARKLIKGFIRQGHDVTEFNYTRALRETCPLSSKTIALKFYKHKTDELLAEQVRYYEPHIILMTFAKGLDGASLELIRQQAPNAVLVGLDGDPWPKLQKGRIDIARNLDVLFVTNDGQWLKDYRDEGIKKCCFMPNACDPDIEYRHNVSEQWKSNILWIGGLSHSADPSFKLRKEVIEILLKHSDSKLYGCYNKKTIGGMDCIYAMSGTKIGVSINAYQGIRLCHSDRLIRLLSCGAFVISNRFPDCELLYKDGKHLRYFDSVEEFNELVEWYLDNETERKKIAEEGMNWAHEQFNCTKIAGYMLDVIESGTYHALWS